MLTHPTNTLIEKMERRDTSFHAISLLYFNNNKKFKELSSKAARLLKNDKTELAYAIAGYVHYLKEDFKKATMFFLKTIELNPDNLDNWIDLAFSLRHQSETKMSYAILFHFDHVIHYYKKLKTKRNNFTELKKMLLLIHAYAN
jgi:tetratricopeptide (TPR) repeat protein